MVFCSKCGAQITEEAAFCVACGTAVLRSTKSQQTQPSVQIASSESDEALKIFIGKNYDYFLRKWEIAEKKKSKLSWNWAAFLLGSFWMVYRKMYLYFWIFIGVIIVEIFFEYAFGFPNELTNAINLSIALTIGQVGNSLYKLHAEKKVKEITMMMNTSEESKIELARQGNTSIGAAIGFAAVLIVFLILVVVFAEQSV